MNRNNIEKITDDADERILLAKLYDKINAGIQRNILAHTGFLSPRQIQLSQYVFGEQDGLVYFGGYPDAERKMLLLRSADLFGTTQELRKIHPEYYETAEQLCPTTTSNS